MIVATVVADVGGVLYSDRILTGCVAMESYIEQTMWEHGVPPKILLIDYDKESA